MTYPPGQGDQFEQPQWQQPEQPQQQWQQPEQQQWQQPGQQQWGPQTGQFPYGQQLPPGPPAGKSKRGLVIGLVVALVALVGGGVTWLALSLTGGASGAASPGEAADTMMTAVQDGDVIGMMDSLAPAEASVLSDLVADYTEELKRIEVLDSSADPSDLSGVTVEATEKLVFDDTRALKVNDHLTMAALTDGTLHFSGKFSEIPLAQSFKDAVIPPQAQAELEAQNPNEVLDIGAMVQQSGQPIYIATVNVDGEWYPSMFHTIAHYALADDATEWPKTSTPAVGAASPNEAIKALVEAARTTDIQKVIELMPPDEMAVLHDLGPMLIEKVNADPSSQEDMPFQVSKLETEESEVTGGTRSTLTALEATFDEDGQQHTIAVTKEGDCYNTSIDGQQQNMCKGDIGQQIRAYAGEELPIAAVEPLVEITEALWDENFGIVTVEVDGKHYVSPLRTVSDFGLTFLKAIEPEHIQQFVAALRGGR